MCEYDADVLWVQIVSLFFSPFSLLNFRFGTYFKRWYILLS